MDKEKIIDLFSRLEVLGNNAIYVEVLSPTFNPVKRLLSQNFLFGYRVSDFREIYSRQEGKNWKGLDGEKISEFKHSTYLKAFEAGIIEGEKILEVTKFEVATTTK